MPTDDPQDPPALDDGDTDPDAQAGEPVDTTLELRKAPAARALVRERRNRG